jgi:hypothetical protein
MLADTTNHQKTFFVIIFNLQEAMRTGPDSKMANSLRLGLPDSEGLVLLITDKASAAAVQALRGNELLDFIDFILNNYINWRPVLMDFKALLILCNLLIEEVACGRLEPVQVFWRILGGGHRAVIVARAYRIHRPFHQHHGISPLFKNGVS